MEEISLKRSAEDILQFMKSVGVTLDNLQKNSCTLSETFKLWKNGEVDFDWDSRKNWSTMHRHWPMLSPPVQDWSGVSQLSDSLMENSEVLWASRRLESWLFSLNNSMSDFKTQFCF